MSTLTSPQDVRCARHGQARSVDLQPVECDLVRGERSQLFLHHSKLSDGVACAPRRFIQGYQGSIRHECTEAIKSRELEPEQWSRRLPYLGRAISEIKTAFIAACIRAGLGEYVTGEDGKPHYQGFTWHGLRHTWATWHIQNGTPTEVLQKLGAWADHRMVMNYAHHSAGYLAKFADNAAPKGRKKRSG